MWFRIDLQTLIALMVALVTMAGLYYENRHDINDLEIRVAALERK